MDDNEVTYQRGPVRDMIIREFDMDKLLDEFAMVSLKRVTTDMKRQEREWEEYWYDLKDEIVTRTHHA